MPLMTNLYTGVSGLNSSQNAINITAHNLANVYTNGYVRQQAQFADQTYTKYGNSSVNTMQIGYGVYNARTQHYRDILLDMAYREQSGREGFYTTSIMQLKKSKQSQVSLARITHSRSHCRNSGQPSVKLQRHRIVS